MDDFAQQVRQQRKAQKLSQQVLAKQVGISRNYLSEIERGEATNLSWQVRQSLADALGLSVDGRSTNADLPMGLEAFAAAAKLPQDDIQMLAGLKYRGQQPTTAEKWELLYNMIKMAVGK
ncbi:helix-turn-helix domain-containing protein [filamentous cyanobacterium LEGE 11480]|uniref:Helix-turn-helix domain-containing protein n=1 Tax=Romeriopsis navalis LEGE 11480 TaxID=2777977 RepID=A0A928VQJ5_9CYAN|nr:helix-turn-helix transcriptional regulator [Romeriopsis navalis]MBE9031917.1 helix-turn-helix domain-containing protein [Romeriopsis navalis LEGE 11480]